MKFVLPFLWIGGFGFGAAVFFRTGDAFGHRLPPPEIMRWVFLSVLLSGIISIYRWCLPLVQVVMTDRELRISNYRREIVVPLSDVDKVTENRWIGNYPVTVRFVRRTDFGHSVVFMPEARSFAFFSSHPIVVELRIAIEAAKRGPTGR